MADQMNTQPNISSDANSIKIKPITASVFSAGSKALIFSITGTFFDLCINQSIVSPWERWYYEHHSSGAYSGLIPLFWFISSPLGILFSTAISMVIAYMQKKKNPHWEKSFQISMIVSLAFVVLGPPLSWLVISYIATNR